MIDVVLTIAAFAILKWTFLKFGNLRTKYVESRIDKRCANSGGGSDFVHGR